MARECATGVPIESPPAKGSNTPNYASLSWSPATGWPDLAAAGSFAPGGATFANPAFWAAVFAAGPNNPDNPYLFRHFYSYNTVRHAALTPKKTNIMRMDGTHPCEPEGQFGTQTQMLGCPPAGLIGARVWLMNNDYESWTAAQADTGTGSSLERYDSEKVTVVEDGTNFVSRNVTLDNSQTGHVRILPSNGTLYDASPLVNTRINWVAVTPPLPSTPGTS